MFELTFTGLVNFNATSVDVAAVSPAGRAFIEQVVMVGAIGANFRKTAAAELFDRAMAAGLKCSAV